MNLNTVLDNLKESQAAALQVWVFLSRTYMVLRRVNPLLGDGLAVFAGILVLRVALDILTLLSQFLSEKYVEALWAYPKAVYKILLWFYDQIRKSFNLIFAIWRTLKRWSKPKVVTVIEGEIVAEIVKLNPTQSRAMLCEGYAANLESPEVQAARILLQEVLNTDGRKRKLMRQLLLKASFRLELAGLQQECTPLLNKAMVETKGTVIKEEVQNLLNMITV
ncbi:hypothetical protein QT972_09760 [Microcoleus sp. herbarium7]|uniref:hypothetical protein n=1 Tax=Microcoleus sp. herbarium7 TaxID=3055435 RepID=UPI002FD49C77